MKLATWMAYTFGGTMFAATLLMEYALLADDFSVGYVAKVGSTTTPTWVTIVSQGGQYVANYLARRGFGTADHNVVWAVTISVSLNALAVSGVAWIQPAYVAVSLGFGSLIFGLGVVADTKRVLKRHDKIRFFGREV